MPSQLPRSPKQHKELPTARGIRFHHSEFVSSIKCFYAFTLPRMDGQTGGWMGLNDTRALGKGGGVGRWYLHVYAKYIVKVIKTIRERLQQLVHHQRRGNDYQEIVKQLKDNSECLETQRQPKRQESYEEPKHFKGGPWIKQQVL